MFKCYWIELHNKTQTFYVIVGCLWFPGGVQVYLQHVSEGWLLQSVEGKLGHDGACHSICCHPVLRSWTIQEDSGTVLRLPGQVSEILLYAASSLHIYMDIYIWRVHLQKPINATWADCRALFFTYSAIWTLNTFCQRIRYCPLSRHREFTFYCRSRQAPLLFLNRSR